MELAVKIFESIACWAGMGFDALCYHSPRGHVRDRPDKLAEAYSLGTSLGNWQKPEIEIPCPIEGCGFRFPDAERLAMHLIIAAGDNHLDWKAAHLSAAHTLANTQERKIEVLELLTSILEDMAIDVHPKPPYDACTTHGVSPQTRG